MLEQTSLSCLLLAPIAVAAEHRNKGIGSNLINTGKKKALLLGYDAIFLVGDPAYYSRFGFLQMQHFSISYIPAEIPAQYVLACELKPNILKNITGSINLTLSLPE